MPRKKFGSKDFKGEGAEPEGGNYDNTPPKPGTYQGKLKGLKVTEIQTGPNAGADRLRVLVEITGPKGAKNINGGSAVGTGVFSGLNITEQGAGYVNQFLHAVAGAKSAADKKAIEKAFWGVGKYDGCAMDEDGEVEKIGKALFIGSPAGERPIGIVTTVRPNKDGEKMADISRFLAPKAADDDDDVDEDDDEEDIEEPEEDDEEDEEEDEEDEDEEEDDESEDEEDEEDSEDDERLEELNGLSLVKLKAEAKKAGMSAADIKGLDKEDLIEAIIDAESEDEDEDDGTDERRAELDELSLIKLKAEAKKVGLLAADIKGLSKDDLIEAIMENDVPF